MSDGTFNLDVNVNLGIEPIQEGMFASEEDETALKDYLAGEIEAVLSGEERGKLVEKWKKWRRIAEGRPEVERKSYPWDGASNVTVPITMNSTHGVFAMLKNIFGNRDKFWKVEDVKGNFEQARVAEAVLNLMADSPDHLDLRSANNTIFYDVARLGTQFVKVPWITDAVSFKRRDANGTTETVLRTRQNSPAVIPIRIEDFLTRPYWYDIQRAPWVSHRVNLWTHELQQRAQMLTYSPEGVEKVLDSSPMELDENTEDSLRRQGIELTKDTGMYGICETYIFWDIDGDGVPEDLIIWFHPETQTILRVEYNDLSVRPIVRIPFISLPYQLYGLGCGWISEPMQDEIDSLHNMRIDATHIAALQMYLRRRGSGGPSMSRMEFRPLAEIPVDDPNDFLPIKFPGVGYESIQAEMLAKEYNDRANQLPDSRMGFENRAIGTRATARGTLFLAGQSDKISSALLENIEEAYGEIGQLVMYQLVKNGDKARASILPMLSEIDQSILDEILSLQVEDIPTVFSFRVQTTDVSDTNEAKVEQKMMLFNLYTMYAERLFQITSIMENPQATPKMRELAAEFFVGGTKLIESIFEHFKERDADSYLPYYKDIELMLRQMDLMKEAQIGQIRKSQSGTLESGGSETTGGNVLGAGMEGAQSGVSHPSQAEKVRDLEA